MKTIAILTGHATKYIESGVAISLARNGHMNAYKGEPVPVPIAEKVLADLLVAANPGGTMVLPVMNDLAAAAKRLSRTIEVSLQRETTDAILVDFINYVGAQFGVDYAMYTSDL